MLTQYSEVPWQRVQSSILKEVRCQQHLVGSIDLIYVIHELRRVSNVFRSDAKFKQYMWNVKPTSLITLDSIDIRHIGQKPRRTLSIESDQIDKISTNI